MAGLGPEGTCLRQRSTSWSLRQYWGPPCLRASSGLANAWNTSTTVSGLVPHWQVLAVPVAKAATD